MRLGNHVARLGKKATKKTKIIKIIQYGTEPRNIIPKVASGSDILPFTVYTHNPKGGVSSPASINAGFSKNNLPIGMQIISNTNKEIDILNLSKQFEDNFLDLNNKPKF